MRRVPSVMLSKNDHYDNMGGFSEFTAVAYMTCFSSPALTYLGTIPPDVFYKGVGFIILVRANREDSAVHHTGWLPQRLLHLRFPSQSSRIRTPPNCPIVFGSGNHRSESPARFSFSTHASCPWASFTGYGSEPR